MAAWMAFVARANPDHIWRHDRGLDLGDWLSVDAVKPDDETTPRALCATAYWAWSAELIAAMAKATGRSADAARYRDLRHAIRAPFAASFLAPAGLPGTRTQPDPHLLPPLGPVP